MEDTAPGTPPQPTWANVSTYSQHIIHYKLRSTCVGLMVSNYLFSLAVTDPEEGLEEVRVGEGEGYEGEEGAEAALQDRRTDVLNGLVRLLVPRACTE